MFLRKTSADADVMQDYNIMIKMYNDKNKKIIIRKYNTNLRKRKNGWEPVFNDNINIKFKSKNRKITSKKNNNVVSYIRSDNLTRCRQKLIDYALNNEKKFKTFITLTFRDNIVSITEANKKFKSFITQTKRKFPDFCYLGVPEFQKRGAVHYHLLTNLDLDNCIIPQKDKENCYDVRFWIYGFSSVFFLNQTDNNFSIALYICKYLYKDLDNRLFGHKKILKSNNLYLPEQILCEDFDEKYEKVMNTIDTRYNLENEYEFQDFFKQYTFAYKKITESIL